jgi:hypothetical protein
MILNWKSTIIFEQKINLSISHQYDILRCSDIVLKYLGLKGSYGKRGLMFVPYYGRSRAFISNYRSWQEYSSEGRIAEIATSLISHETLHLTLNKFSFITSAKLDNLFGRSNKWEKYPHGLGDLDMIRDSPPTIYKNARKMSPKRRRKH